MIGVLVMQVDLQLPRAVLRAHPDDADALRGERRLDLVQQIVLRLHAGDGIHREGVGGRVAAVIPRAKEREFRLEGRPRREAALRQRIQHIPQARARAAYPRFARLGAQID